MEATVKLPATTPVGLVGAVIRAEDGHAIGRVRSMRFGKKGTCIIAELEIRDMKWAGLLKGQDSASLTISEGTKRKDQYHNPKGRAEKVKMI